MHAKNPPSAVQSASADASVTRAEIEATAFASIPDLIDRHARNRPWAPAIRDDTESLNWAEFAQLTNRVAARLQLDRLGPGDVIAVCAQSSVRYAAVFLGAVRAGVAVAPLAPGSTPGSLAGMVENAGARWLFLDDACREVTSCVPSVVGRVALDDSASVGEPCWRDWLAASGAEPAVVLVDPSTAFNVIYSSGTTGEPKGIVQSHGMRWGHVRRVARYGWGPEAVTLLSTPLYSNTTLVALLPAVAYGGGIVLMAKFDAARYLQLATAVRATHTMLVPVQYQRLLSHPDFDEADLSSFQTKFCTSAPFPADTKAEVLRRWPGALVEIYGMTEGGGTCVLDAHLHPDKLHTVGRPLEGCDMRVIDDEGQQLPGGQVGEIVGHSATMMTGYHARPDKTREVEWFDAAGRRFIRTGDIGRFDEDGFLILQDRRKDVIISGGFNIYPSDLEAVLLAHEQVAEAAVVGVPSPQWGETPVAFVVARGDALDPQALRDWANRQLGKTQRILRVKVVDELPRSGIGKVLKRALREQLAA